MRFSNIYTSKGEKLSAWKLEGLGELIVEVLKDKGFKTEYSIRNGKLKVGMRMKSFVINAAKLGHNSRYTPFRDKVHRTSTPSWEQRVQYNDTINDVMDMCGYKAIIRNSIFTIRTKDGRMNEGDWYDQKPMWMYHNENNGYKVIEGFGE